MDFGFPATWFLNGQVSPSVFSYGFLFVLGGVAGVLNVVAGGGSFLTLPLFIFLGLSPSEANGTNRVGIFLQNLFAVWSFQRHDLFVWPEMRWTVLPAVVGAPLGAWLALSLPDTTFQKLLAFLMVGITLWSVWNPSWEKFGTTIRWSGGLWIFSVLGFFLVGVYGGLVQAGVGFFILAVTSVLGYDLVRGNAVKVFTILVFTGVSLPLFAWNDKVDWLLGLVLAGGTVLGGLLGVKLTVLKGHQWLRHVVTIMAVVFALRLWFTA